MNITIDDVNDLSIQIVDKMVLENLIIDCTDTELENELNTLETSCSNCSMIFTLSELRNHLEACESTTAKVNHRKSDSKTITRHLSESQADALKRAQAGENRSTFQCPFCERAK